MKNAEIKQTIQELDAVLDTDITDSEFDEISEQVRNLYHLLSVTEKEERFLALKEIKPTEWENNFLNSFLPGTRIITTRQYQVLRRMGKNEAFRVERTAYEFSANTKCGHLVVTKF